VLIELRFKLCPQCRIAQFIKNICQAIIAKVKCPNGLTIRSRIDIKTFSDPILNPIETMIGLRKDIHQPPNDDLPNAELTGPIQVSRQVLVQDRVDLEPFHNGKKQRQIV
jgi:hypothetical protein